MSTSAPLPRHCQTPFDSNPKKFARPSCIRISSAWYREATCFFNACCMIRSRETTDTRIVLKITRTTVVTVAIDQNDDTVYLLASRDHDEPHG